MKTFKEFTSLSEGKMAEGDWVVWVQKDTNSKKQVVATKDTGRKAVILYNKISKQIFMGENGPYSGYVSAGISQKNEFTKTNSL